MTSTTSYQQGTRPGAVIVLASGQGHDPDGTRNEGLTGRSGGYQAPMTQEQDRQGQDQKEPQPEGLDPNDGPRVLLVDDAAAIRNALRGVLEDAGIEVVGEAQDGVQGVAMVGSLRPDVVLMDLRMPSSNGFQATEQIVQEHPAVRVVVLSAYETEESAEAVRAAGAFAFLPKHCGADRIRDTVVAAWRSGGGRA
jgi:CheY-like chemotaxis protein